MPSLADGVELIGEYEDSGFVAPPSIVRRGDGQVLQLPDLLYQVLVLADGRHSYGEVADAVSHRVGRAVTADNVGFLVEEKLRPMGLLRLPDGSSPQLPKPDPFLALKFRVGVIPERVSGALGDAFKWLFRPLVLACVLVALVCCDAWLFLFHGVAQSLRQALYHPALFLPLFGAVVLGAAFHETGHAAACRYGGGRPGRMGCGLYLAWPAFYTDVTDAYRLGKRARLRTDLGGVYFNVVVILASVAVYLATHVEAVLLVAVIEHFEIVHQLLPIVRLDGYYIVADLTGVPDLFARIGPILRSMVPGHPADPRVTALKRWVRRAVAGWILFVIPLLAFELLVVLIHLPRILGTAWDAGRHLVVHGSHQVSAGQIPGAVSTFVQVVVLAVPVAGILLMLHRFVTATVRAAHRHTEGHPALRVGAVVAGGAAAGALAAAWIPAPNYRPIQPNERGTLTEGSVAAVHLAGGRAPLWSVTHDLIPPASPRTSPDPVRQPGAAATTTTSRPRDTTTTTAASRSATGSSQGTTSSTSTSTSSSTTTSSTTSSSTTTSTSTTSTSTTSTTAPATTATSAP